MTLRINEINNVNELTMSVHLTFERTSDTMLKRVVSQLSGPYVHTEMVVTSTHEEPPYIRRKSYSAYIDYVFFGSDERSFRFSDTTHDFLQINASPKEIFLIKQTCDAHVEVKTPYNLKDMVLSILPGRNPTEIPISDAKTLFCSQAMVLILRSCLEKEHPVVKALEHTNSRTVSPTQLFQILKPVCQPALAKHIMRCT